MPEGESDSYSAMLAQSVFCFALMGDGFSSRTDDAIIHGCALERRPRLCTRAGAGSGPPGRAQQPLACSVATHQPASRAIAQHAPPRPRLPSPTHHRPSPHPSLPACSCIPVLIQDGVEPTWSNLLDTGSYSVRILQKDMERVPEILQAISKEDVARMQANLGKVWRRWVGGGGGGGGRGEELAGQGWGEDGGSMGDERRPSRPWGTGGAVVLACM